MLQLRLARCAACCTDMTLKEAQSLPQTAYHLP